MSRRLRHLPIAALQGVVLSTGHAHADEVVTVYLTPPSISQAIALDEANARELALAYASYKKIWDGRAARNLSYTVTTSTAFLNPTPCNGVPIRVRIVDGKLTYATYDRSAPPCRKGDRVKESDFASSFLTPQALFQQIANAVERVREPDAPCLRAEFDPRTGLPVRLEGGCTMASDSYYEVRVTQVSIEP